MNNVSKLILHANILMLPTFTFYDIMYIVYNFEKLMEILWKLNMILHNIHFQ